MKLKVITISPDSPFRTPLRSDTLMGHILWYILYLKGQSYFDEFKSIFCQKPQFVISDAFYQGYLPKPIYFFSKSLKTNNVTDHITKKKQNKTVYLPLSSLLCLKKNMTFDSYHQTTCEHGLAKKSKKFESGITSHNTIDRILGTSVQTGGGFYQLEKTTYKTDLEIYVSANDNNNDEALSLLLMCLANIGRDGFGADASTGRGRFKVSDNIEEIPLSSEGCNCFMNLSTGIIDQEKDHIKTGYYKFFTRFGRLGGHYASQGKPFKKPVLLLEPGSVFHPQEGEKIKPYYGKVIDQVHKHYKEIFVPAYMLPFPLKVIN